MQVARTEAEVIAKKILRGEVVTPKDLVLEMGVRFDKSFDTYCPICKVFVEGSEYLHEEAFPDDYFAYWIANLVKHYRHEHVRYYDLSWRYWSYGDKNPEYKKLGHDGFKILVNNRAKRQLIRAILKDENLSGYGKQKLIQAVLKLQYNDGKTVELVNRTLQKLEREKFRRTRRKKKTEKQKAED